MDVKDYCKGIQMALTAWKAKLYDMMTKVDKLSTGDKQNIFPNIEDLKMVLAEMDATANQSVAASKSLPVNT